MSACEESAVGGCRGRESTGHRYPEAGQVADHFAERGVLAADRLDVIHAQLVEPDDVAIQILLP